MDAMNPDDDTDEFQKILSGSEMNISLSSAKL